MGDTSAIQIGAGAAGLVSASAVIMILLQRTKDYWPALEGRGAMFACDAVSFIVAFIVIYQTTPDWWQGVTWIALAMLTLSFGVTARALYSQMFHVAVQGSPPSAEATVDAADVNDPNATPDAAKPARAARRRSPRGATTATPDEPTTGD